MKMKFSLFVLLMVFLVSFLSVERTQAQQIIFSTTTGSTSTDNSNLSIPAQFPEIQEQIDSDVSPETPQPNSPVTITLTAYGTDLNQATITWTMNGKMILRGQGKSVFTFTTGGVGSANNITAAIVPSNGPEVDKTFSFSPSGVDLLWEANTYTPPFYRGKALFTPEATVMLTAIPTMVADGFVVPPSKVIYKWSVDGTVEGSLSGLGINSFSYTGDVLLQPHSFSVDTSAAADSSVVGTNSVTLNTDNPSTLLYEVHPLYGVMFNEALNSEYQMTSDQAKIAAYPYFFSTTNKNANLTYAWTVNTENVDSNDSTENTIVFKKTGSSNDNASIGVDVTHNSDFMQEAGASVSVAVNAVATSLFGSGQ